MSHKMRFRTFASSQTQAWKLAKKSIMRNPSKGYYPLLVINQTLQLIRY